MRFEHAPIGQVGHQRRERLVEFAELLDVEVEVLVVRVVVRVRDLNERRPFLEQPAGQQAVAAEVVLAVTVVILGRLFARRRRRLSGPSVEVPARTNKCRLR